MSSYNNLSNNIKRFNRFSYNKISIFLYHTIHFVKNNIRVPSYCIYHDTISIIISQKISFSSSREIRRKMMELNLGLPFTYDFINYRINNKLLGISDEKYQTMKCIPNVPNIEYIEQEIENYISYISNIN